SRYSRTTLLAVLSSGSCRASTVILGVPSVPRKWPSIRPLWIAKSRTCCGCSRPPRAPCRAGTSSAPFHGCGVPEIGASACSELAGGALGAGGSGSELVSVGCDCCELSWACVSLPSEEVKKKIPATTATTTRTAPIEMPAMSLPFPDLPASSNTSVPCRSQLVCPCWMFGSCSVPWVGQAAWFHCCGCWGHGGWFTIWVGSAPVPCGGPACCWACAAASPQEKAGGNGSCCCAKPPEGVPGCAKPPEGVFGCANPPEF